MARGTLFIASQIAENTAGHQDRQRKTLQIITRYTTGVRTTGRILLVLGFAGLLTACAQSPTNDVIDRERQELALLEVQQKHARGQRVWCVPYARSLSGINIRGNAKDWWGKARNIYKRGDDPEVGSVMSFKATRGMSLGHVAVVSDIVSDRHVIINHANWSRNKVSLEMGVVDISKDNDWSLVRVESYPGQYGRPYPVNGFIYPKDGG